MRRPSETPERRMNAIEAERIGNEVLKYLHEHVPEFYFMGVVVYPTEVVIAILEGTIVPELPKELAGMPLRVEVRPMASLA